MGENKQRGRRKKKKGGEGRAFFLSTPSKKKGRLDQNPSLASFSARVGKRGERGKGSSQVPWREKGNGKGERPLLSTLRGKKGRGGHRFTQKPV